MSTPAQIAANLINAQKSTGPTSALGKEASSRNACSHGLTAKEFVTMPGEEEELREFIRGFREELRPQGPSQEHLFRNLVHAAWTLRRCRTQEAAIGLPGEYAPGCFSARYDPLSDVDHGERLRTIGLYARRAENTYCRMMKELRKLQTEQQIRAQVEPATAVPGRAAVGDSPLIESPLLHREVIKVFKVNQIVHENLLMAAQDAAPVLSSFERTKPIPTPANNAVRAAINEDILSGAQAAAPVLTPFEQTKPIPTPADNAASAAA